MTKKDDLMKFMMDKLGGEKAVQREYAKERLMKAVSGGTTFGEIIEIAKQEDWLPILLATPIGTLAGEPVTLRPPSGRITLADKATLHESVLSYLKDNPWSGKSAIADAVGFEPQKVAVQIRSLKANGAIKSSGKKSSTVYAVKGEKGKPTA